MTATPILIALAVGVLAMAAMHRVKRARLRELLRSRRPLSEEEFGALFPAPLEREVAQSVRRLLAPWVSCDVALIRPEDEFCADLLLDAFDGLDPHEFLVSVEKRWGVDLPRGEAAQLKTVAELAAAIAPRLDRVPI